MSEFDVLLLKRSFCNPAVSCVFLALQENPDGYKDLTASFVTILKQVLGGKLPMDFNYHSVPAPWLQIQLLRILSLLGKNEQRLVVLSTDEVNVWLLHGP